MGGGGSTGLGGGRSPPSASWAPQLRGEDYGTIGVYKRGEDYGAIGVYKHGEDFTTKSQNRSMKLNFKGRGVAAGLGGRGSD